MNQRELFFVIDSDHLDQVETCLYGWSLSEEGLTDGEFAHGEDLASLSPIGSYDLVERDGDLIRISTDYMGSQGLYVYRDGAFFAVGNSLLKLAEYVKTDHPITLNRDFVGHILTVDLAAITCRETLVQEIMFADRGSIAEISVADRTLSWSRKESGEMTVPVDSEEGMAILDRWHDRWTGILRKIYENGGNLVADLSGGFDSRMSFLLLLNTGIDPDRFAIRSLDDGLHTHAEDLRIACMMGERLGFRVNDFSRLRLDTEPFRTAEEILAISLYSKGAEHKQMYYKYGRFRERMFKLTGGGGESVRSSHWDTTPEALIREETELCRKAVSEAYADEAAAGTGHVMRAAFEAVGERFPSGAGNDLTMMLYRDARCRFHFGKDTIGYYLRNEIKLQPMLDPDLHRLRLTCEGCADRNLIPALLFVRFRKDMLDFPFDHGRSVDAETIAFAEAINDRFPRTERSDVSDDMDTAEQGFGCPPVLQGSEADGRFRSTYDAVRPDETGFQPWTAEEMQGIVRAMTASPMAKELFCRVGDEETYVRLCDTGGRRYHPVSSLYGLLATVYVTWFSEHSARGDETDLIGLIRLLMEDGNRFLYASAERADVLSGELGQLRKKIEQAEKKNRKTEEELRKLQEKNAALETRIKKIEESRSFKAANALAAPVRKLRKK